jgi:hypothetical protein
MAVGNLSVPMGQQAQDIEDFMQRKLPRSDKIIPRVTKTGKVSGVPNIFVAMLAEVDGRMDQIMKMERDDPERIVLGNQARGLAVAYSILCGKTIEVVIAEAAQRYQSRMQAL